MHRLSIVGGTGDLASSGDGGAAAAAGITVPHCFTLDQQGNMFVRDSSHRIRRIDEKSGTISTVAGNGHRGFAGDHGPGRPMRNS